MKAVQATGRKTLIMAGVWTSVCVMFPALDAKAAGYKVYAVIDASGDPSEMASRTTIARFAQAGVIPTSAPTPCSPRSTAPGTVPRRPSSRSSTASWPRTTRRWPRATRRPRTSPSSEEVVVQTRRRRSVMAHEPTGVPRDHRRPPRSPGRSPVGAGRSAEEHRRRPDPVERQVRDDGQATSLRRGGRRSEAGRFSRVGSAAEVMAEKGPTTQRHRPRRAAR